MRCWRIDLRRNFSQYLNGELSPRLRQQIEAHLLDCGHCRTQFVRLRTGHRVARQMRFFVPKRDPWMAIEAAIAHTERVARLQPYATPMQSGSGPSWHRRMLFSLVFGLAILAWAVVPKPYMPFNPEQVGRAEVAIARDEFHEVSIADIERNTEPHVVAEGYVTEVRINREENVLSFKLVESLQQAKPFIICEIMDPIKLPPPAVGSHVRVYGVSRYDSQLGYQWYEIHPVLKIEVLTH
jgi:hypothetical protein